MDGGAILFIIAVLYYGLINRDWQKKPAESTYDVHQVDVLHGGDDE